MTVKRKRGGFGIHVSMWTMSWSEDFVQYFGRASESGFDAVEIPLLDPDGIDVPRIRRELEKQGLAVFCGTGLGFETDIASTDEGPRKKGEEHLKRCIDIAAELGSPTLEGVLHSAWGKTGGISDQEYAYSAEVLHRAAEHARQYGIRLCLECLNRYETSFLNTAAQALSLIERAAAENIGVHLDTYHMNIEERSVSDGIRTAGDKLFFFHLSENTRGYPGNGSIDWNDVFGALDDISYKGPLVIESYVLPDCETGDATFIWRPIEKDTGSSLSRSVDFLRSIGL